MVRRGGVCAAVSPSSVTTRPSLLYVSPVVPDTTGGGLAMRSGLVLEQLAAHYDVSLLAVPVHGHVAARVPLSIARLSAGGHVTLPPARPSLADLAASARRIANAETDHASPAHAPDAFAGIAFSAVHVYRLTALPFAAPYLTTVRRPVRSIDLDEVESATRLRLAGTFGPGDRRGRLMRVEAGVFAEVERTVIDAFEHVYVCSPRELAALAGSSPCDRVRILPNALPEIPEPEPPPARGPFTFLFVGTLAFPANADAVGYLCDEVLPIVRARAPGPFRMVVVGPSATDHLIGLARSRGVEVRGAVADVSPSYQEAHTVVAPLRHGGGARLKIIEAMRAGRPIVTTTEGMAGIALRPGVHVLIGDDPAAFAAQCIRLMADDSLGRRLARAARDIYIRDHRPAVMADVIRSSLSGARPTGEPAASTERTG